MHQTNGIKRYHLFATVILYSRRCFLDADVLSDYKIPIMLLAADLVGYLVLFKLFIVYGKKYTFLVDFVLIICCFLHRYKYLGILFKDIKIRG